MNQNMLHKEESFKDQPISQALISVSDKTELQYLGAQLSQYNITILSTGGTAKTLRSFGFDVTDVSDYTGSDEIMDGRVKTLHPKIHAGLLGCLDNEDHVATMQSYDIKPIDLVIVNLYPFEKTAKSNSSFATIIENIDIGGPSMIRSAAKNFSSKTVVTDPSDYKQLFDQLSRNNGKTTYQYRKTMAAKAFALIARYDIAISSWFSNELENLLPQQFQLSASLKQHLRYGENPHQNAAFYVTQPSIGVGSANMIQGKELSFNNISDADAAIQQLIEFPETCPTAVIVKHASPCGVAKASTLFDAYCNALACDTVSAFGGIIALNDVVDIKLAEKINEIFVEAVIAPDFSKEALTLFKTKKNLRIIQYQHKKQNTSQTDNDHSHDLMVKQVMGGILVQENDKAFCQEGDYRVVTKRAPTDKEMNDMLFAFKVCKHVKSNAIVLAKNSATVGIGGGQTSRVDSSRIAVMKACDSHESPNRVIGSVLASDAFFPFADGVLTAAKAGVRAIIQPGGSIRDNETIEAANEHDIAMVFTGKRHFRH